MDRLWLCYSIIVSALCHPRWSPTQCQRCSRRRCSGWPCVRRCGLPPVETTQKPSTNRKWRNRLSRACWPSCVSDSANGRRRAVEPAEALPFSNLTKFLVGAGRRLMYVYPQFSSLCSIKITLGIYVAAKTGAPAPGLHEFFDSPAARMEMR